MKERNIYLVLDNIRSRENVGSIFRTADGAGVTKIYLCGTTPCPPHDKISKTALGAEKWVPWEYRRDTWRVITDLSAHGGPASGGKKVQIIALEQTKDAESIYNMFGSSTPKHVALVVGNEVRGISPKILKYCDKKIAIPMYGRKESLNVSVATGIALYELRIKY